MKILNRNISVNNHRFNINHFKNECGMYSGTSFNLTQFKFNDCIKAIKLMLMPYKWINKQFMKNKI